MQHNVQLPTTRNVKVYFVEEDDEKRERVICGTVRGVSIRNEADYNNVVSTYSTMPVATFRSADRFVLEETEFVPDENGVFLRMENFWEQEEDEDDFAD